MSERGGESRERSLIIRLEALSSDIKKLESQLVVSRDVQSQIDALKSAIQNKRNAADFTAALSLANELKHLLLTLNPNVMVGSPSSIKRLDEVSIPSDPDVPARTSGAIHHDVTLSPEQTRGALIQQYFFLHDKIRRFREQGDTLPEILEGEFLALPEVIAEDESIDDLRSYIELLSDINKRAVTRPPIELEEKDVTFLNELDLQSDSREAAVEQKNPRITLDFSPTTGVLVIRDKKGHLLSSIPHLENFSFDTILENKETLVFSLTGPNGVEATFYYNNETSPQKNKIVVDVNGERLDGPENLEAVDRLRLLIESFSTYAKVPHQKQEISFAQTVAVQNEVIQYLLQEAKIAQAKKTGYGAKSRAKQVGKINETREREASSAEAIAYVSNQLDEVKNFLSKDVIDLYQEKIQFANLSRQAGDYSDVQRRTSILRRQLRNEKAVYSLKERIKTALQNVDLAVNERDGLNWSIEVIQQLIRAEDIADAENRIEGLHKWINDIEKIAAERQAQDTQPASGQENVQTTSPPLTLGPIDPIYDTPPQGEQSKTTPKKETFWKNPFVRVGAAAIAVISSIALALHLRSEEPKGQAGVEDEKAPIAKENTGSETENSVFQTPDAALLQNDALTVEARPYDSSVPSAFEQNSATPSPTTDAGPPTKKPAETPVLKAERVFKAVPVNKEVVVRIQKKGEGVQKAIARTLAEQGMNKKEARSVAKAIVNERIREGNAFPNKVQIGDYFTLEILTQEDAEKTKKEKGEKKWQEGESFTIGSRSFTVGKNVQYTPLSGKNAYQTSIYEVVGMSQDKIPGLLLYKLDENGERKGRKFAISGIDVQRAVRAENIDTTYNQDWMVVEKDLTKDGEDTGKRRIILSSVNGNPPGKGILHALKQIIAHERGISLAEAAPDALVALKNADVKDPDLILPGTTIVLDVNTLDLNVYKNEKIKKKR